jgi:hypothetical protein
MQSLYKKKLSLEIDGLPENEVKKFYKIIRVLKENSGSGVAARKKNVSLRGIWKGSALNDRIFESAKESLFHYEGKENK